MLIAFIHAEAVAAAKTAVAAALEKNGGRDDGACGFAWVTVSGVKLSTKVGKEFKAVGFDKAYGGGIDLWNPSGYHGQNVWIKYEGAQAYAKVFQAHGFRAYAADRLD
jgi:hypothetical protein